MSDQSGENQIKCTFCNADLSHLRGNYCNISRHEEKCRKQQDKKSKKRSATNTITKFFSKKPRNESQASASTNQPITITLEEEPIILGEADFQLSLLPNNSHHLDDSLLVLIFVEMLFESSIFLVFFQTLN